MVTALGIERRREPTSKTGDHCQKVLRARFRIDFRAVGDNRPAFTERFPDVLMVKAGVTSRVQLDPANVWGLANRLRIRSSERDVGAWQSLSRLRVVSPHHQQAMRADPLTEEIELALLRLGEVVIAPDGQSPIAHRTQLNLAISRRTYS